MISIILTAIVAVLGGIGIGIFISYQISRDEPIGTLRFYKEEKDEPATFFLEVDRGKFEKLNKNGVVNVRVRCDPRE